MRSSPRVEEEKEKNIYDKVIPNVVDWVATVILLSAKVQTNGF